MESAHEGRGIFTATSPKELSFEVTQADPIRGESLSPVEDMN